MARTSLEPTLSEPTIGFERDEDGRPALPRMGPAMAILTWLGACGAMWALFAGLVTIL